MDFFQKFIAHITYLQLRAVPTVPDFMSWDILYELRYTYFCVLAAILDAILDSNFLTLLSQR